MAKTTIIRYILDEGVPSRGHRKLIFTEGFNYIGISMRSDNNGGYKGTLDLCSSDLQTKGNQSNTTTPVQNNSRNETPKKSPSVHKNNANMKLISHENESDIFDKMKMGNNKGKVNKSAQSVSTSTKTVTKNGIKTTTVTKVTKYTDGST